MTKSQARTVAVVLSAELSRAHFGQTQGGVPIFEDIEASMSQENEPHVLVLPCKGEGHKVRAFYRGEILCSVGRLHVVGTAIRHMAQKYQDVTANS